MGGSSTTSSLFPTAALKPLSPLLRWLVWSAAAFSTLLAIMLLMRGFAGAVRPLDASALLTTGVLLALLATLLRISWLYSAAANSARLDLITLLLPLPALLLIAAALSLPQSPGAPLTFFWGILIAQEGLWWLSRYSPASLKSRLKHLTLGGDLHTELPSELSGKRGDNRHSDNRHSENNGSEIQNPGSEIDHEELEEEEAASLPPEVNQQLTRSRDESGADVIYGLLRGGFESGERVAHLHLAFCPPFKTTPELQVHQIDGQPIQVKAAQVHTFGARIDLKLTTPCREPQEMVLEVYVRAEPPRETN